MNRLSFPWLYPTPTGDVGRDRNALTLQFAILILGSSVLLTLILNLLTGDHREAYMLGVPVAGLIAAAVVNRSGDSRWAARIAFLSVILSAVLLVADARDGFRSHAMLLFPGLLLISVLLLDRAAYITAAAIVLITVAALGIADMRALFRAEPLHRTPTNYVSIIVVDLHLLVIALVGSRIARDAQGNVVDLRTTIDQLSDANVELKRSEDLLRASDIGARTRAAELEAIMDAAPAAIFVSHDPEGRYITGNRTAYSMFRCPADSNLSLTTENPNSRFPFRFMRKGEAIHAQDLPLQRAMSIRGPVRNYEATLVFDDNSSIELLGDAVPMLDEDGKTYGAVAVLYDVTERKRTETLFQAITEISPDPIYVKDRESRFLLANPASLSVLAKTLDEIRGKTDAEIFPDPAVGMHLIEHDRAVIESGQNLFIEERVPGPAGDRTYLSAKMPFRDARGDIIGVIGISRDISERIRAESALRESEERFRSIADSAPVIIWICDADKNCTFINKRWVEFTGSTEEEQLGSGWASAIHPDDLESYMRTWSAAYETRTGFQAVCRFRRFDGEYRWILDTGTPRFQGDEFIGLIGSCVDITAQKQIEERQKLESVGTLASGIAHDFNNLLGAVLVQAELALSELQSGLRPEQELRQIREVAIHGADIVRQLMIYAGKENQVVEPVNLSQLVGEMLELLRLSVSKSVTLETGLDQQLPSVKVNPAQLRQIVMNLVTNASEAIGTRTGVIRLTTEACSLDGLAALAAGLAEGRYVRLLAADNGRGMSAETQARAFEPFFTTKSAGRGLGLAVVHGIVRSLGGAVRIESKLGEGTTFEILLPCCEMAAPLTAASSAPNGDLPPLHESAAVLLVEDEDALRQAIAKLLRKVGFDVFEAGNGTAAIDLLHAHGTGIDAILLDMTIPGHSSADVLAEVAMIRPPPKVLLTSAYTEEMVTEGLESPLVLGFIRKPFQLTTLLRQLRGILANS